MTFSLITKGKGNDMLNLRLHTIRDASTLDAIRQIDTQGELRVSGDSCFWVGSVSTDDRAGYDEFLNAAGRGDLLELARHNSIEDNLACAVLVRDAKSQIRFHLFIIEIREGLWTPLRVVLGQEVSEDCSVEPQAETDLPEGLVLNPKLELWKAFIGGFFGKHKDE